MDGALNHFKLVMRLSISSDNCVLGFSDAKTIDSLLDNVVVDLSSSGRERRVREPNSMPELSQLLFVQR